ncbi:Nicotinamide-nucleotide adenylyltransferase, NadR family / Ribosylnicotinamide kinase [Streptococcus sp. DD11]|uniref:AAA family ATPase n=1 Tax=Streptococcus sp. DD11 TaxID=1777879 RepID=UPI00079495D8|nr:AAA family ATPase [Streptococcus sp. DD11]KXT85177.1 Nicotinamide-nucleotide adenylyltransferase, NadR family / Ribosylnicotinamide kinase [Streptococcus sp. DD11]
MKERTAIVFGTFAPLHQGHIDLIQKAKRRYDRVKVVVSGYEGDRGQEVGLSLQKRFRYIRETFSDDELTQVYKLDETALPRYPLGWDEWLSALLELIDYQPEREELIFFVGEADYQAELAKRGFDSSLQGRQFGISASMIRENPSKYWKYIAQPFRRQFTKKVLIIGSASNGKTTLAKDLARFYDAPVSLEYAREYQIQNNVRDDELTPKDYYYLLLGQYAQTSRLIDSNANRGLVVADTNSLVTKGYYDYYLKESPAQDDETATFDNLFSSILAKEKWDLVLFVQPVGSYVNDGFRDMSMADEAIRQDFSAYLDRLRQRFLPHIPMVYLASDYLDNYQAAKEAIDSIYQAD